jgi:hypothetical protein
MDLNELGNLPDNAARLIYLLEHRDKVDEEIEKIKELLIENPIKKPGLTYARRNTIKLVKGSPSWVVITRLKTEIKVKEAALIKENPSDFETVESTVIQYRRPEPKKPKAPKPSGPPADLSGFFLGNP